ncbi:hypothetical protein HPP92_011142 [Vanilla planifolia]|uniref:Uncharacterized protein n=1 Tax=Vanilla planifolia TaxID=51239 RepID=A0A835R3P9_VANPL|nr:hypothetical protein HPP92_011142 [Vanilla planifolia]
MYIVQKKVPKWSTRWVCLQTLSFACLVISVAAAVGSIAGVDEKFAASRPLSYAGKRRFGDQRTEKKVGYVHVAIRFSTVAGRKAEKWI